MRNNSPSSDVKHFSFFVLSIFLIRVKNYETCYERLQNSHELISTTCCKAPIVVG